MNILHILDEPYDSGISQYGLDAARGLAGRGHRVFVAARPESWAARQASAAGLEVWDLRGAGRRAAQAHVELVNAHTGSGHTLGAWIAFRCGAMLVRTRADARPPSRNLGSQWLHLRRTARVITPAEYLRRLVVVGYGLPGERVVTVRPGMELEPGLKAPAIQGAPEPDTVGIVGRLDPVKGHRLLLEAVAVVRSRRPGVKVLVAGREEMETIAGLLMDAGRLGVDQLVEFLGHVPALSSVMSRCAVGVVASVGSEAVSRVALEWMAHGRPLVASAVGCLPEVVEDGVTGRLVPPGDPVRLGEALLDLLSDPGKASAMGRRGRERVESVFGFRRFAEETERVYEAARR
ncbi:MAG: glycosyltransferase family 4 protein [bacterium]